MKRLLTIFLNLVIKKENRDEHPVNSNNAVWVLPALVFVLSLWVFAGCAITEATTTNAEEGDAAAFENKIETGLDKAAESEAESEQMPVPGGKITIDSTNPKTFNPVLNEDLSVDTFLRLVYEPLIALDDTMKPFPAIASAWNFSPDGLTLSLTIREEAVWADGSLITAHDVIYTLDAIKLSPDTSLYKKCAESIAGYTALDDKTLTITYDKPFGRALYNLTFPVIPRGHFMDIADAGETEIKLPLGSGLYKITEFNPTRNIKLVRSDNCYKGAPQIENIEVVIVRESSTPLYSFEQNMIDITYTKNTNWKKIITTRNASTAKHPSLSYEFIAMNYRRAPLNNISIRKAIALVLPKETIIDKYYSGNMISTDTPLNPESWLYEPDTEVYGYDPQKAKEYVAQSQTAVLGQINIMANNDNYERTETVKLLKQELEGLGFIVTLDLLDFETYKEKLTAGDFDIAAAGADVSVSPDFSPFFSSEGAMNFVSYNDSLMTAYLVQADTAVFETAQKTAYSSIQKQFAEQLPFISIGYKTTVILTGDNIHGQVRPVVNNPYNNIEELSVKG